mgnify:FL=1
MRYGNHDRAVNWNHLREIVEERGWSGADFSLRMGKSKSWLAGSVKDDRKVTDTMLTQMALLLECSEEELTADNEHEEEPATLEPSQFELDVMEYLRKITSEISSMKEILMYLFNEKQQGQESGETKKQARADEHEIAVKTLESLMENKQAIKYDDYMKAARKNDVLNSKIADAAIAKLGYHKRTAGYGNNKKLWIHKEVQL